MATITFDCYCKIVGSYAITVNESMSTAIIVKINKWSTESLLRTLHLKGLKSKLTRIHVDMGNAVGNHAFNTQLQKIRLCEKRTGFS